MYIGTFAYASMPIFTSKHARPTVYIIYIRINYAVNACTIASVAYMYVTPVKQSMAGQRLRTGHTPTVPMIFLHVYS